MNARRRVFVVLVFLLSGCGSKESGPSFDPLPADLSDAFDQQRQSNGAPGVSVAVWMDGRIAYAEGLGSRDPDGQSPMGATSLLRIGSVTKMMTAAVALQAVEDGKLSLDDHVADVLAGWSMTNTPQFSQEVTLEDLLTHQGALVDYTPIDGNRDDASLAGWVNDELTQLYQMAPPGEFYNYSNPNFAVAGAMVEAVDGERYYPQIVEEDLWRPLGIRRAYFHAEDVLADGNYATGQTSYPDYAGAPVAPDTYDHAGLRPAGFAWMSAVDLARFGGFLMEGNPDVLADTDRTAMQSDQVNMLQYLDLLHYGYGIVSLPAFASDGSGLYPGVPVAFHDGAIPGFSAMLYAFPDQDIAVAVLSNADGSYFATTVASLFEELAGALPQVEAIPDPDVNAADFPDYAGTYEDPFNVGSLVITENNGALELSAPDLDAAGISYDSTLIPLSRGNFVWTVDGFQLQVTFVDGSDGTISEYFRTRVFVATRNPQAAMRAPARARIDAFLNRLHRAPSL